MLTKRYLFLGVDAVEGDDSVAFVLVDDFGDFPLIF